VAELGEAVNGSRELGLLPRQFRVRNERALGQTKLFIGPREPFVRFVRLTEGALLFHAGPYLGLLGPRLGEFLLVATQLRQPVIVALTWFRILLGVVERLFRAITGGVEKSGRLERRHRVGGESSRSSETGRGDVADVPVCAYLERIEPHDGV